MRRAGAAAVALVTAAALAGCSSDGGPEGSASRSVPVQITDAGCEPARLTLPAGPTTFEVENTGTTKVTEFEVLDGKRILGEAENLAPGLSGRFSLTLEPGTYATYCPGGDGSERGVLVVTGGGASTR